MDKNIEEYLRSPLIKLEKWKKIADSSLKDKTVKDLEKLFLYRETLQQKFTD